ncbi:WXG100 family type VII secretion target [Mycolicibacterium cosmeticum]|uniref:WXG100 family type VII secretion target n=1 Tax=Mycolicibacterium cosmeticum TaxID=258533 RepID=UPI0032049F84
MTQLVVDFGTLQAAIEHMQAFEREVTESLEDIDHTMAALRASWHGESSDSQAQAQQQWEDGAEQMKSALKQLRSIAQAAHKNYSEAVTRNGAMWG